MQLAEVLDQDHENYRVFMRAEEVELDVLKQFCSHTLRHQFKEQAAAFASAAFNRFRPLSAGTQVVVKQWAKIPKTGDAPLVPNFAGNFRCDSDWLWVTAPGVANAAQWSLLPLLALPAGSLPNSTVALAADFAGGVQPCHSDRLEKEDFRTRCVEYTWGFGVLKRLHLNVKTGRSKEPDREMPLINSDASLFPDIVSANAASAFRAAFELAKLLTDFISSTDRAYCLGKQTIDGEGEDGLPVDALLKLLMFATPFQDSIGWAAAWDLGSADGVSNWGAMWDASVLQASLEARHRVTAHRSTKKIDQVSKEMYLDQMIGALQLLPTPPVDTAGPIALMRQLRRPGAQYDGTLVHEVPPPLATVPPEAPALGQLSLSLVDSYVPRGAALQEIAQCILRSVTTTTTVDADGRVRLGLSTLAATSCALKGQGGVGKTNLASAFVREGGTRTFFADGGILWLNPSVEGADLIESTVIAVAERIQSRLLAPRFGARYRAPPNDRHGAVGWIAARVKERKLRILVVLNNVLDPELVAALSSCGLWLLVTTRERQVAGGATLIEVNCVDDETGKQMLARAAGLQGDLPVEAEAVRAICAGLPITLAVAGALFAQDASLSWAQLAGEWSNAQERLSELLPEGVSAEHASLRAMIEVSMRRLPRPVAKAYRSFALVPSRFNCLFGEDMLGAFFGTPDVATTRDMRCVLESHSLLTMSQDGTICTVHDLHLDYLRDAVGVEQTREVVERLSDWLVAPGALDSLGSPSLASLRGVFPLGQCGPLFSVAEFSAMALWRAVERAAGRTMAGAAYVGAVALQVEPGEGGDEALYRVQRLSGAGRLLQQMGRLDEAFTLFERARVIEEELGESLVTTLQCMGVVRLEQCRYTESIQLFQRASEIGPEDVDDRAKLHRDMSAAMRGEGRLDEALSELQLALPLQVADITGTPLDTEMSEDLYEDRFDKAVRLSVERRGHASLGLSFTMESFVLVRLDQECLQAEGGEAGMPHLNADFLEWAEDMLLKAWVIRRAVLGSEHQCTAKAMSNLGIVLQHMGRLDEAAEMLELSRVTLEERLGDEHPDVGLTLNDLGHVRRLQGQQEEALRLFGRAQQILEDASNGPNRIHVGKVLQATASVRLQQAREMAEEAARRYSNVSLVRTTTSVDAGGRARFSVSAVSMEERCNTTNSILTAAEVQGAVAFDEALRVAEEAGSIFEHALGHAHPRLTEIPSLVGTIRCYKGTTLRDIAHAHLKQNNPEEAMRLFYCALAEFEASMDVCEPTVVGESGALFPQSAAALSAALRLPDGRMRRFADEAAAIARARPATSRKRQRAGAATRS